MTNVSKQSLDKKVAVEIWTQLGEVVGRLNANQAPLFLTCILTDSEQIMIAKRLAAIVLIHEEHSNYAISETLKISNATATKLRMAYMQGAYNDVLKGLRKNKTDYANFVETLIDAIHLGLPRYVEPKRLKAIKGR